MITVGNNGSVVILDIQADGRKFHVTLDKQNATLFLLQMLNHVEQISDKNIMPGRRVNEEIILPRIPAHKRTVEDFLADVNDTIRLATSGIKKNKDRGGRI